MYVCVCKGISDHRIRDAVRQGHSCFEDLQRCTGVSTCCGKCEPTVRAVVEETVDAECNTLQPA